MKRRLLALSFISLAAALMLSPAGSAGDTCGRGTPYRGCSACGSAEGPRAKGLNVLKNRDEVPPYARRLNLNELRSPSRNVEIFNEDKAVELIGIVASVEAGGVKETANCEKSSLRNVQIGIVASPQEAQEARLRVIAEITPRWQERLGMYGKDIESKVGLLRAELLGRRVMFRGWLLNNYVHATESESLYPGRPGNWRATPWELHPVTSFKLL